MRGRVRVREALEFAVKTFSESFAENPRLEAEILLAGFLKKDRLFLITHGEDLMEEADFKELANRRAKGEPLAYILNRKEFYGREFFVDKSVLIPRPETELLIDTIIDTVTDSVTKEPLQILDLCAGSGCIGLTLAKELDAKATLADISADAIEIIKRNAKKLDLYEKVNIVNSDLFQNIEGKFDILVSNPPYIASEVIETLESTVKDYEPRIALDGGKDGLEFYEKIISQAKFYLKPYGKIFFEIGFDEAKAVSGLLRENGYEDIRAYKDLAGLYRVVGAKICIG